MEREVGGGIGMGKTCNSMADSCQCMTKPLQYCKIISLQLILKKFKKNKKNIVNLKPRVWTEKRGSVAPSWRLRRKGK